MYSAADRRHLKGRWIWTLPLLVLWGACQDIEPRSSKQDEERWEEAAANAVLNSEGLERCQRFVEGWLAHADPKTGLIPRNLEGDRDIWNAKDAAADNYPFMVLTAALTDRDLFEGRMRSMLDTEQRITSRIGHLPDTYQFSTANFKEASPNLDDIIFGASEYVKDGLLPLTEYLGSSPWSQRMLDIIDDIWANAEISTDYGKIPSENEEVNGEMLQVLSRVHWMTQEPKYLDWAYRLGDYYLLGDRHPTRDLPSIRLRDHGCEILSGLCELYSSAHYRHPDKQAAYRQPLHELLDRVLEVGRNEHGLFYDVVNPRTGEILRERIADNFGYNLDGFYTVYQLDSIASYRDATLQALEALPRHYRNHDWENGSADGYADAIEGALNLYNREPVKSTKSWLDSEMQVMWAKQQDDGVIEGWHGDGNFARTTIMYCLWKSQGVTATPWRPDLQVGATSVGDTLWISLRVDTPWEGTLHFDLPRHRENLHLPHDWPRINQFPEWYTVEPDQTYSVWSAATSSAQHSGTTLIEGLPVSIEAGETRWKIVLE